MKNSNTFDRHGFTLLELLLALAVFSIVIAALYGTFFASYGAVTKLDDHLIKLHEARTAIGVLGREIESSIKSGKAETISIKDRDLYGKSASEVSLVTFSSLLPGASRVSYFVEKTKDGHVLKKSMGPAWKDAEQFAEAAVIEDVESFRVEVLHGDKWVGTWHGGSSSSEAFRITISVDVGGRSLTLTEVIRPAA